MSIAKKPTSKQSGTDNKTVQSTTGGNKQRFDKQKYDRSTDKDKQQLHRKPRSDKSNDIVAPAVDNPVENGTVGQSEVGEEKKSYIKRERKQYNKDKADSTTYKDRRVYNRDDSKGYKGKYNKNQQSQINNKQAESIVPLPKPGISFLSALNTGLIKPKETLQESQPAQSQPQQLQSPPRHLSPEPHPSIDQAQPIDSTPATVDELKLARDREAAVLAARIAAAPQPRGVWKKKTQADIDAEKHAEHLAQQQHEREEAESAAAAERERERADVLAQQQRQQEFLLEQDRYNTQQSQSTQQEQDQYDTQQSQDDNTLADSFDHLNVSEQPLSPAQQPYDDKSSEQISPEPIIVPQPLHQPLPNTTQFQQSTQPQSHSIFGSYGNRSTVNELLSQNDSVVLPRHIQNATQQYSNISFGGAFNLGNRSAQPTKTDSTSIVSPPARSPQPLPHDTKAQNISVSPQPSTHTYASSNTNSVPQQVTQPQQSQPPAVQPRFNANNALSPLLPSQPVDQNKQPSAEPQTLQDYTNTADHDTNTNVYSQSYNDIDPSTQHYQPHPHQSQYQPPPQQYDQSNNYYSQPSQYGAPQQYDDIYNNYNDQYRPKSGNKSAINPSKQPIGSNPRINQQGNNNQNKPYNQPGNNQNQQYNNQYSPQGKYNQYQRSNNQQNNISQYNPPQQYAPVNKSGPAQQPGYKQPFNKPSVQSNQPPATYPPHQPYQYTQPSMYAPPYVQPNMYSQYTPQPMYNQYTQQPYQQVPPGFRPPPQQQPAYYSPQYQYNAAYQPQPAYGNTPTQDDTQANQPPSSQHTPYQPASNIPTAHTNTDYTKQSPESGHSSGRNTGIQNDSIPQSFNDPSQQPWQSTSPYQPAPPQQYNSYNTNNQYRQPYNQQYHNEQPQQYRHQQWGSQ